MYSQQFRSLQTRIRRLREHFLPRQFEPTGRYSELQLDRARAYRLLAHAEIESYLEQVVSETANEAYDIWENKGLITDPLIAMVAYWENAPRTVPTAKPIDGPRDLRDRVKQAKDSLTRYANAENHGIRERNILRLLLPIGINEYDIDTTWLSTTDSFGRDRGDSVHRSNRVTNPPDPKTEHDRVGQILEGLMAIDHRLLKFRTT